MRKLLVLISMHLCLTQVSVAGHFISDVNYRGKVDSIFNERMDNVGWQFFNIEGTNVEDDEVEALQFLYAYMPLADITDYPTTFFLDNIRISLTARQETAWGSSVPEQLFRHFVIPVRVNNEALDSSRIVFYNALKERVAGMSMSDAILEVNHWCHERVTYQPSDARTSSPLATIRNSTGRCGEESTLTVAALRSIGIPARQVYTPRWAHTDDNHAWVEAWADGEWFFIGACEPEPALNIGWFNSSASRALLMHTRVFGEYYGTEDVILRSPNFTEINLTANYAEIDSVKIKVVNLSGRPVPNAKIELKIYNYAEFCTVATKHTDDKGETMIVTGKGDLLIWASKDGEYGYAKVSTGKDRLVILTLDKDNNKAVSTPFGDTFDIVPPKETASTPSVSEELKNENKRRLAYEDSLRTTYASTFLTAEEAEAVDPEASVFLVKARGNHKTISDFLLRHHDNRQRALALLATLSDKDLCDITAEILDDSYTAPSDQLSPRVENEMITIPFKHFLHDAFSKEVADSFRANPSLLAAWVKDSIRVISNPLILRIAQTPVGVMRSRITDSRSRDIFFVDVARSLGIEARKDPVTSKVQYFQQGEWFDVQFETAQTEQPPKGKLLLNYEPSGHVDSPQYYSHFTISRIKDGCTSLLSLDEGQVDMGGGASWEGTFKNGMTLDAGTYILTTGTRLANGSVLAAIRIFEIKEGETTVEDIVLRQSNTEVGVIGSFDSESKFIKDGNEISIVSNTGRGYFVLGIIGVGQEPTNHALHDIEKKKEEFEAWGRPIVLLCDDYETGVVDNKEFGNLPSTISFGKDSDGTIARHIAEQMKLTDSSQLPIFIIADTFNRVVFVSQGYTIGLGEQLLNVIKKL